MLNKLYTLVRPLPLLVFYEFFVLYLQLGMRNSTQPLSEKRSNQHSGSATQRPPRRFSKRESVDDHREVAKRRSRHLLIDRFVCITLIIPFPSSEWICRSSNSRRGVWSPAISQVHINGLRGPLHNSQGRSPPLIKLFFTHNVESFCCETRSWAWTKSHAWWWFAWAGYNHETWDQSTSHRPYVIEFKLIPSTKSWSRWALEFTRVHPK